MQSLIFDMINAIFIRYQSVLYILVALFGTAFGDTLEGELKGELMLNPNFDDGNYEHWEFSGFWRPDGEQNRLVYDMMPGELGYIAAVGSARQLAADIQLIRDLRAAGSRLISARLSGLTLNAPYLAVYNTSAIGPGSDYLFFIEVDVKTQSGLYRASTEVLSNAWDLYEGPLQSVLEWDDSPACLGDIAEAPMGGVPLVEVEEILYKCVIQVRQSTPVGTGPVFLTIDNCSLEYVITYD